MRLTPRTLTPRLFAAIIAGSALAGFAAVLLAALTTAWLVNRNQAFVGSVAHTYEVEQRISNVRVLFERAEASSRGYLLSGSGYYRDVFYATVRTLPAEADTLATLVADNPPQQRRALALTDELQQRTRSLETLLRARDRDGPAVGRQAFAAADPENLRQVQRARVLFRDLVAAEERLLRERRAALDDSRRVLFAVLTLGAVVLALTSWLSVWAIRRGARDTAASRRELRRVNAGLEDAVQARTADLSRANEEIQRFAYIVSHDLRAPLVNVMGFTAELDGAIPPLQRLIDKVEADAPDLVDEDARLAAREDLPEAVGFIRTSTQKMDRLINAILALSRQGRRLLAPEPLDMARLVQGVADSLAVQVDRQGARIDVAEDLPRLTSDRLALEQVFSNLLENALKYAEPARPVLVAVRGRREGARLLYEVSDNGRGIDAKDHERVFDLFRRSGRQDQPGEGIGLANVRALVYRLGGTIALRSRLGEGATFIVNLPPVLTAAQARQDPARQDGAPQPEDIAA